MHTSINSIYNTVFAHRGFHLEHPENTMKAFEKAVSQNFGVEVGIRILKCGTIVCFHDIYMKRLLSVPGRISKKTYAQIKKYRVLDSDCKVPKLADVMEMIKGKVPILIEIKGILTKRYKQAIMEILSNYDGEVYIHTKNIYTFLTFKRLFPEKVFFILSCFRRRFEFVKGKHYKNIIAVPTLDNLMVEVTDDAKTVIRKIRKIFNGYTTRVNKNHWLLGYNGQKYNIQHRAILDPSLPEHSKENILKCIEQKRIVELDITRCENKIVCYHNDRITRKLGQEKSIASKVNIESSLSFEEAMKIINGNTKVVIDVKDAAVLGYLFPKLQRFKFVSKTMAKEVMEALKDYNIEDRVIQSYNPLFNLYLKKKYPDEIRGQIGHSLSGLKAIRNIGLIILNFCLFYTNRPDYIVYDLDERVHLLSKFNNVIGLPVIGYTATSEKEIIKYSDYFDNFVVEGKVTISDEELM